MAITATQERFAQALVKYLPGLNIGVARAWAKAEVGDYNNLGIMDAPGKPHRYATPEEGAKAAADLINSSSNYAGIRSSLSSTNPNIQASAIATSPWHLGKAGLRRVNGIDPYYARIFKGFGFIITGNPKTAPVSATQDVPTGPSLGAWGDIVSFPVGHKITNDDVSLMLQKLDAAGYFKSNAPGGGDIGRAITEAALRSFVGQEWNKSLQDQIQAKLQGAAVTTGDALDPTKQLPSIFGNIGGRTLLIVGGILLIGAGIWIVVRQDAPPLRIVEGAKAA